VSALIQTHFPKFESTGNTLAKGDGLFFEILNYSETLAKFREKITNAL
jgi:hypothetical protein